MISQQQKNIAHEIKRKYFQINNEVTKLQKWFFFSLLWVLINKPGFQEM